MSKNADKVRIGRIVNAVGLKGEVKVYNYSDSNAGYSDNRNIYVENTVYMIEKARFVKNTAVLKLKGVGDRDGALALKERDVYIDGADLPELAEETYYIRDMIGISVFDDTGYNIGKLSDVIKGSAQDLYEVETTDGKKILIPAVGEFITGIDIGKKRMDVKLIEGLI